jgi:TRAP-type C4-dicarboxylate transport system permease small subunit
MIKGLFNLARWVGALVFLAVFGTFVVAVFMGYVAGHPLQWSDEFVTIAAMWLVFWMSAFVIRDEEQVSIDLLWRALPPGGRRVMGLVSAIFFGAVFAVALPSVLDYVLFLWRSHTNILEWRLDFVFMCMPLFFASVVFRSAISAYRLLSPSWRTYVTDPAENSAAGSAS